MVIYLGGMKDGEHNSDNCEVSFTPKKKRENKKVIELIDEMKNRGFLVSHVVSPFIYLDNFDTVYIWVLTLDSVHMIQCGKVFYLNYTNLSDNVLDKILEYVKTVKKF